MRNFEEMIKERKSLCSGSFFARIIGYNVGWVNQAEHGRVKVSNRFLMNYEDGLEKIKKIVKN